MPFQGLHSKPAGESKSIDFGEGQGESKSIDFGEGKL